MGQAVEALETVRLLAQASERQRLEAPVISALARLIEGTLPLDEWIAMVRAKQPAPARFARPSARGGRGCGSGCVCGAADRIDRTMKTDIHPEYVPAHVRCTCGNEFWTRSTKAELHVEICSNCHPFYTGRQKLVDTGGRVERFRRRAARAGRLKTAQLSASDLFSSRHAPDAFHDRSAAALVAGPRCRRGQRGRRAWRPAWTSWSGSRAARAGSTRRFSTARMRQSRRHPADGDALHAARANRARAASRPWPRRRSAGGASPGSASAASATSRPCATSPTGRSTRVRVDYRWYDEDGKLRQGRAQALARPARARRAAQPAVRFVGVKHTAAEDSDRYPVMVTNVGMRSAAGRARAPVVDGGRRQHDVARWRQRSAGREHPRGPECEGFVEAAADPDGADRRVLGVRQRALVACPDLTKR